MTKNLSIPHFVEHFKKDAFKLFPALKFIDYYPSPSGMHILEIRPAELFKNEEFCEFIFQAEQEFIKQGLGDELCFWDMERVRIAKGIPATETKKQIPFTQKVNAWFENLLEEIKYEYLKPTLVGMAGLVVIVLGVSIVFFQQKQGLENEKNRLFVDLKAKNEEIASLKNGKPIGEPLAQTDGNSEEQIQNLQKKLVEVSSLKDWYRKQINAFPSKVLPLIKNAIPMIKGENADLRTGEYQIVNSSSWKKINIYLIDKRKKEFACFLTKNNDDLMLEIGKITANNNIIVDGIGEFALNGNNFELK